MVAPLVLELDQVSISVCPKPLHPRIATRDLKLTRVDHRDWLASALVCGRAVLINRGHVVVNPRQHRHLLKYPQISFSWTFL